MIDEFQTQAGAADACPSPHSLIDWLADRGKLTQIQLKHVDRCQTCQQFLHRSSDDTTLQQLASSTLASGGVIRFADEPELKALLSKLRQPSATAAATLAQTPGRTADETDPTLLDDDLLVDAAGDPHLTDLHWVQSHLPAGRFQLERILGAGGAGAVFLAYDNVLARQVAIKILTRDSQRDRQRLEREAKLLAELEHPNVVRIFDVGQLDASAHGSNPLAVRELYLVMEYVSGGTADQLRWLGESAEVVVGDVACSATSKLASRGHASWYWQLASLFASAADGLSAVHAAGLVHRDVKPSNLLLDSRAQQLKVADFGLARWLDANATLLTRSGDVIGTPAFMSPEQAAGGQRVSNASDVYSLGASLYFCLTGTPMFRGQPASIVRQIADVDPIAPRLLNAAIPIDLETICLKAIEKDSARRYDSAKALAEDLRRFGAGEGIQARPPGQLHKLARFLTRNRSLSAALGIALLLLVMLLVGAAAAAVVFRNQSQRLVVAAENESLAKQATESALAESIAAADQLLLSVTEDAELLPRTAGTQQISQKLLQRAGDYYQKIIDSGSSGGLVVRDAARAHSGLARVALALSDSAAVQREVDAALTLLDAIPVDEISEFDRASLAARTLSTLGADLNYRGDPSGALEVFKQAERRCRSGLDAIRPNLNDAESFTLTLQLAEALRGRAIGETTLGNSTAAEVLLLDAQEIFEGLLQIAPEDETVLRQAAGVASSLGLAILNRDGYTSARQHFETSRNLLAAIRFEGGLPIRIRAQQAKSAMSLAQIQTALGNPSEAADQFQGVLEEFEQLVALEPSVASHKFDLALAMLNSCQAEMKLGNIATLRERCRKASVIMQDLVSHSPDSIEYLRTLAKLQANVAIASRMLGEPELAIEPLEQATELTRLCALQLGNPPESMYAIALNQYSLSQCYYELGRIEEGLGTLAESITTTTALLDVHADYLPARMHQVDELVQKSDLLMEAEPFDAEAYLANAKRAEGVSQKLLDQFNDLLQYEITHAIVLSIVGDAHVRLGEYSKAHETADLALARLERLFPSDSGPPEDAYAQAALLYNQFVHLETYARELRSLLSQEPPIDRERQAFLARGVRESLVKCQASGAEPEELQPFRQLADELAEAEAAAGR